MALGTNGRDGARDVDRRARPNRDDLGGSRQPGPESPGAGLDGQDQSPRLEGGLRRVEVATARQDGETRLGRPAKPPPQVGVVGCRGRVDVLGRPDGAGIGAQGAGAHEDDVGAGTEQAHDETVRCVVPADRRPRLDLGRREGHDPVERGHKIGVQPGRGETNGSSVQSLQPCGEIVARQPGGLEMTLEGDHTIA